MSDGVLVVWMAGIRPERPFAYGSFSEVNFAT